MLSCSSQVRDGLLTWPVRGLRRKCRRVDGGSPLLIQKLRLQRGWSQEQLAELSGLSVRTIQRLERGQTASVESLKALGAAFEMDFSDLKEPEMDTPMSATPMSQSIRADEALALAHVRKLKGFYIHLVIYVIVISFLVVVNLMTY